MTTNTAPSIEICLENVPNTEDLDDLLDEVLTELLADEDLSVDLIDLINQNFVLEVEASRAHSETTGENGSNADTYTETRRDHLHW